MEEDDFLVDKKKYDKGIVRQEFLKYNTYHLKFPFISVLFYHTSTTESLRLGYSAEQSYSMMTTISISVGLNVG